MLNIIKSNTHRQSHPSTGSLVGAPAKSSGRAQAWLRVQARENPVPPPTSAGQGQLQPGQSFLQVTTELGNRRTSSPSDQQSKEEKKTVAQSCLTLRAARLLRPWDSPGKNTGVGCHAFLQGILSTQGSNPGLWHCRWILYCLSHQGSPPKKAKPYLKAHRKASSGSPKNTGS